VTRRFVNSRLRHLLTRMLAKDPADRISLREIRDHDWVTVEGTDMLPIVHYVRVTHSHVSSVLDRPSRSAVARTDGSGGDAGVSTARLLGSSQSLASGPSFAIEIVDEVDPARCVLVVNTSLWL
jgi:hypothetical protein